MGEKFTMKKKNIIIAQFKANDKTMTDESITISYGTLRAAKNLFKHWKK